MSIVSYISMFSQNLEPKKWSSFAKYKKKLCISVMRRFTWIILQWNKNNIKSSETTNGDYGILRRQNVWIFWRDFSVFVSTRLSLIVINYSKIKKTYLELGFIVKMLNLFMYSPNTSLHAMHSLLVTIIHHWKTVTLHLPIYWGN